MILLDGTRAAHHKFYNTKQWKALRQFVLQNQPWCSMCLTDFDMYVPATDCDHIIPLTDAPELCLDPNNIQPLCHECHSHKTNLERLAKEKVEKIEPISIHRKWTV